MGICEDSDIEFHDAVIEFFSIDYENEVVDIYLKYYESSDSSKRKPIKITFTGVEQISLINDLIRLKKNKIAGNINYWIAMNKEGYTTIYLMDGCISIKHKDFIIERL